MADDVRDESTAEAAVAPEDESDDVNNLSPLRSERSGRKALPLSPVTPDGTSSLARDNTSPSIVRMQSAPNSLFFIPIESTESISSTRSWEGDGNNSENQCCCTCCLCQWWEGCGSYGIIIGFLVGFFTIPLSVFVTCVFYIFPCVPDMCARTKFWIGFRGGSIVGAVVGAIVIIVLQSLSAVGRE